MCLNLEKNANFTSDSSKFEQLLVKKEEDKAEAVDKNAFVFIVNLLSLSPSLFSFMFNKLAKCHTFLSTEKSWSSSKSI